MARHAPTRKMLDKGFFRTDEEYQLESGGFHMQMRGNGLGRAGTFTEMERCNLYMEDNAQLLRGHELPRLALTNVNSRSDRSTPEGGIGGGVARWDPGSKVKKYFSTMVESSPSSELLPVF